MNRDGIKIAWKIDRKTASPRSVTKRKPFTGSKTGWRAAKRLGFQQRLSFYGRVILSYALRAGHIVTGCFGTVFAPALIRFPVMPELPNLRDFPNPDSIQRVSPVRMAHLVFRLIYPFGRAERFNHALGANGLGFSVA